MIDSSTSLELKDRDVYPFICWKRRGEAILPVHWLQYKTRLLPLGPRAVLDEQDDLRPGANICLIGEHGSGHRTVMDWLLSRSRNEQTLIILDRDGRVDIGSKGLSCESEDEFRELSRTLLSPDAPPGARHSAWLKIRGGLGTDALVCLNLLSLRSPFMPLERHRAVTTELRAWRDKNSSDPLRLVLVTTSEETLYDINHNSDFITIAKTGRLPVLTIDESASLLQMTLGVPMTGDAGRQAHGLVGGQPRLLVALCDLLMQDRDATKDETQRFNKAASRLREEYPASVNAWRRSLRQLLQQQPPLIKRLSAYVRGRTYSKKRTVSQEERVLFVGGWVGYNENNRWGIRSKFHERVVREVIVKLRESKDV